VSPVTRHCFTLSVLLTMGLFLWSNLSVGATVHVLLSLAGTSVPLPSIFDYTLFNSVRDFWSSEAYALAILVMVFSGVWTYVKLSILLCLWWMPPSNMSPRVRDYVLHFLDATGKWCLVDTLMFVLLMVAMHFDIRLRSTNPHMPDLVEAKVETTPGWGLDSFVIATLLSLALTQVELHYHRIAIVHSQLQAVPAHTRQHVAAALGHSINTSTAEGAPEVTDSTLTAQPASTPSPRGSCVEVRLASYEAGGFYLMRRDAYSGKPQPLTCWARVLVDVGLISALCLTCSSLFVSSFTLHVVGLVGAILGPDSASTTYTFISLAGDLPSISTETPQAVLYILQAVFVVCCLVLPVVWILMALFIWWGRWTPHALHTWLVYAETVYAWATLDVFLIVLFASLLELDKVVKFTIGDECDGLNQVLQDYPALGDQLPGEASCFGVTPGLSLGMWLAVAGVVISNAAGGMVMCAAHTVLQEGGRRASGCTDIA